MRINPVAQGASVATMNPDEGRSAGASRLEKAKAIAAGQEAIATPEPESSGDRQVDRLKSNQMKRIKMRTNLSPDRQLTQEVAPVLPLEDTAEPVKSDTLETNEQTKAASEDTNQLSPQFAALAREKRKLQLQAQELSAKESALKGFESDKKALDEYRARIKANALSVLQEEGVTYDQLTEQILASNQGDGELLALKAKVKALEEGIQNQTKTLSERDQLAETQALNQIKRDTEALVAKGDDFEMIREAGYAPKVVELIHKTWKQTGELIDTIEAARLIETELFDESLKFAKIKKVQSRLNPPAPTPASHAPIKSDREGVKVMRTLTNRDGASSVSMSKRERAIAAMEGRLK